MGLNHGWRGPNIVRNGLVLYLDAGSPNSYQGSGTTWKDISKINKNNGTLVNGPTFNSANGGNIVFDGVDDYVLLNSVPVFNTELTYCGFIYPTNLTGNRAIFSFRGILLQVYTNGLTYWSNITTSNKSVTASGLNLNQWNFISISQINDNVTFYYNSNNLGTFIMTNPLSVSYGYKEIGRFGEGDRQFAGNMGNFLFYNRALSSSEVQQNFNANRGRFGI